MNRFEKISLTSAFNEEEYNDIKLPKRATSGSCGYDFYAPFDVTLEVGESIIVPTGIKWVCDTTSDLCLKLYIRSSLGFKYHISLANGTGIIDNDYWQSDNEGHIMIKLVNNGDKPLELKKGDGFAQGVISEFYKTNDDTTRGIRNGGFGSTNK